MKVEVSVNSRGDNAYFLHTSLCYIATFGCASVSDDEMRMVLLSAGFVYQLNNGSIKLFYPKGVLRRRMKQYMKAISESIRSIDIGAALEYQFMVLAQNGVTATCMKDTRKMLEIPPSHMDFWRQSCYGEVLQEKPDKGCLIMKLAEKHCAIDFLILDCSPLGVRNKQL